MPIDPAYLHLQPVEIQSPVQSIGALMQMRNLSSEIDLRRAQAQEQQQLALKAQADTEQRNRDLADERTIMDAQKDPVKYSAFGRGDFSSVAGTVQPKTLDFLKTQNANHVQSAATTDKVKLENIAGQHKIIEDTISGLKQLGDDGKIQEAAPGAFNELVKQGVIPSGTPMPKITGADDLDRYAAQNGYLQGVIEKAQVLQGEKQKIEASKAQASEATAKAEQTEYETGLMKQGGGTVQSPEQQVEARIPQAKYPDAYKEALAAGNAAAQGADVRVPGARQKAFAEAVDKVYEKLVPYLPDTLEGERRKQAVLLPGELKKAAAEGAARAQGQITASGATEDDFSRAGQQYAISGVMPPLGMGAAGRLKVEHYAQEFARQSGLTPRDLAVAQAAFKGDTKSLENFQKQRDQIVSFEQTAQKNLDLFLTAAAKIPDTDSPWLNAPLRTIDQKALGSAELAAVNAARQVANNEIAKVTSGGGLGGVLSDAARGEVQKYNPNDATFKQTVAVAKILRQDMANRHASMDATLGEIKSRIGTPGAPSLPVQPAGGMIRARDPQGKLHEAPAGTALPPGWKLE